MSEICFSKKVIEELLDAETMKLWVSKKQGRREQCIFTFGTEQFQESVIIDEQHGFIIRGQNISKTLQEDIRKQAISYE